MKKLLALIAFYLLYVFCFYLRHDVNEVVYIKKGESLWQIDQEFSQKYLIPHRGFLFGYTLLTGNRSRIKSGEYRIRELSLKITIKKLVKGECILYKIVFPEGITVKEVVDKLNQANFLKDRILTYPSEGTLFPATYLYSKDASRLEIIRKMKKHMDEKIETLWQETQEKHCLYSKEEALNLASIVEKETHFPHERVLVASVFLKRLRIGMPLQADPTVAYGLGVTMLKKGDIAKKSPYNTYKERGLPPTPICCPGAASLEAVFQADDKTPYLYFVVGEKGHNFSTNLRDHHENVRMYRKIQKAS